MIATNVRGELIVALDQEGYGPEGMTDTMIQFGPDDPLKPGLRERVPGGRLEWYPNAGEEARMNRMPPGGKVDLPPVIVDGFRIYASGGTLLVSFLTEKGDPGKAKWVSSAGGRLLAGSAPKGFGFRPEELKPDRWTSQSSRPLPDDAPAEAAGGSAPR